MVTLCLDVSALVIDVKIEGKIVLSIQVDRDSSINLMNH